MRAFIAIKHEWSLTVKLYNVNPGPFFRRKSLEQHMVLQTLSSSRDPPSINSSDFRFQVVFNHLLVLIVAMAVSLIWIGMRIGRSCYGLGPFFALCTPKA